jgi:hypothetical protein
MLRTVSPASGPGNLRAGDGGQRVHVATLSTPRAAAPATGQLCQRVAQRLALAVAQAGGAARRDYPGPLQQGGDPRWTTGPELVSSRNRLSRIRAAAAPRLSRACECQWCAGRPNCSSCMTWASGVRCRQPCRSRSGVACSMATGPRHSQATGRIWAGMASSSRRNCSR